VTPRCRLPDCPNPPCRGSFVFPKAKDERRFPVALLCDEHGKEAVSRGARRITYRPFGVGGTEDREESE
jgi:hypothetical protein